MIIEDIFGFVVGLGVGIIIEAIHHNRIRKISDKERIARYEERIDCMEKKIKELQE